MQVYVGIHSGVSALWTMCKARENVHIVIARFVLMVYFCMECVAMYQHCFFSQLIFRPAFSAITHACAAQRPLSTYLVLRIHGELPKGLDRPSSSCSSSSSVPSSTEESLGVWDATLSLRLGTFDQEVVSKPVYAK